MLSVRYFHYLALYWTVNTTTGWSVALRSHELDMSGHKESYIQKISSSLSLFFFFSFFIYLFIYLPTDTAILPKFWIIWAWGTQRPGGFPKHDVDSMGIDFFFCYFYRPSMITWYSLVYRLTYVESPQPNRPMLLPRVGKPAPLIFVTGANVWSVTFGVIPSSILPSLSLRFA